MTFDPDKFLAETEEFDPDKFLSETEGQEEPSQLETLGRGVVQGGTFGGGEELGAAALTPLEILRAKISKLIPGSPESVDAELRAQGFTGDIQEPSIADTYRGLRDPAREANKAAKKAHPGTYLAGEVAGGVLPTIFSGGTSAVANTGRAVVQGTGKELLKAVGKSAAAGGGYGAVAGAGYSEADLTKGDVGGFIRDVATSTGAGALLGGGLPVLSKAAGKAYGSIKKGAEELIEKAPTVSKPFQFAKEHGLTTKPERLKIFQDDVEKFVTSVKDKFKEIGMSEELASSKAKDLKKTIDLTGDFDEAAKKLYKEAEMLTGSAQKKITAYADDIQTLSIGSQEKAAANMEASLQDDIQKKLDSSKRKEVLAPKKAESKLVQYSEKTGDEIEQITQGQKPFEEVADIPFDTQGGVIDRSKGKMSYKTVDEDGNEIKNVYDKIYTEDVTPFQPTKPKVTIGDDKVVGEYANQATGEVFKKYGKLPPKGVDFSKMNIDELSEYLSVVGKRAFDKGGDDSEMYRELWKIARNGIEELLPQLSKTKADQSKLYQVLDILGIDKSSVNRTMSHSQKVDVMKKIKTSGDLEKGYVKRNLLEEGSDISKKLEKADLTEDVSKILEGSTSATGEFTKAGLAQKTAGTVSSALGSVYGKAERIVKPAANYVTKLPEDVLKKISGNMVGSKSKIGQAMGRKLEYALSQEESIKHALIWQLSTQPAFRRLTQESIKNFNEDAGNYVEEDLGFKDGGFVEFDQNNLPASYRTQEVEPIGDMGLRSKLNEPVLPDTHIQEEAQEVIPTDEDAIKDFVRNYTRNKDAHLPGRLLEFGTNDNIETGNSTLDNNRSSNTIDSILNPKQKNLIDNMSKIDPNPIMSYGNPAKVNTGVKKGGTDVNEYMEGNIISADFKPPFNTGAIKGIATGGVGEDAGHAQKTRKFIDPITGDTSSRSGNFNLGIDYIPVDKKGKVNTSYNPSTSGEVVFSGKLSGYGNTVIIKSEDTVNINGKTYKPFHAYAHNKKNLVKTGFVKETDNIAEMGKSGLGPSHGKHVDYRTFLVPVDEVDDINVSSVGDKLHINPLRLNEMVENQKKEKDVLLDEQMKDSFVQRNLNKSPLDLEEHPSMEDVEDLENDIDRVNRQQGSGDSIPVNQLEDLLGKIDKIKMSQENKDLIAEEAINMSGFSDGNRLKELLRGINKIR